MNRRKFLRNSGATAAFLAVTPGWSVPAPKSAAQDQGLLEQARDRIRKFRQADGAVVVRDKEGQPLAGVKVAVEQIRHQFLFGCNFFRFDRLKDAALEQQYRERFASLHNYATLPFYWPMYEPERGQPQYGYTDRTLEWCQGQNIVCKGHPLVWDFSDPRWLPRDFAEIQILSRARVRDCVNRFKGRLDIWDVVNEPTHLGRFKTRLGEWAMSMGEVPYVADHLRIAREANPQATLLVNDYRTDEAFYKILDALREGGRLGYDAVGIQSHMHGGNWPLLQIWDVCDRYAKLGLPIHFTEMTYVSGPRLGPGEKWGGTTPELEVRQADYVADFYTMLYGHPAVQALTWWDFSDNGAWQGAAAGLVRKDMSPKPVYDRLMALVKGAWWTNAQGQTNDRGEYSMRAFLGTHRITATLPDGRKLAKDVVWKLDKANRVELNAV